MLGIGILQGVGNAIQAHKANKQLESLLGQDPTYQKNPLAAQQFAMAQQLYNGRMAGAASQERNIFQNQANTVNAVNKNATDSSQALALAMGAQGQADKAFSGLRQEEAQNKYQMLGNLNQAYAGMINEDDKAYNDKLRKFSDIAQIRGAQQQNRSNALNGIFNGLNSEVSDFVGMGGIGGISNFFGGGKGNSGSSFNVAQPNIDAQMYQTQHQFGLPNSQILSQRP